MPKFLEPLAEKILLTGKYLNAIHETDRAVKSIDQMFESNKENNGSNKNLKIKSRIIIPNACEIVFTTKEEVYKQLVENAYNYSSKILLNLLLNEHKLIDRLR